LLLHDQLQQDACGDCLASSVECLLSLPAGTLPRPVDGELDDQARWIGYMERLRSSVQRFNAWLVEITGRDEDGAPITPPGWSIGSFAKPSVLVDGRLHAIVCRNGEPYHDPHPALRRMVKAEEWGRPQYWSLLVPLDPRRPVGVS
jgi:hypothetical protein